MKAINEIKKYIQSLEEGESFTAKSLRDFATSDNIRQILARMVLSGEIQRVTRGVYVKPKYSPRIGMILPSAKDITSLIANTTGEIIGIHGAEAARQLQLTTQVPFRLVFYTTGYTREIKIKNQTVLLKHVNPSKLIAPGTTAGTVISAFLYLGKEQISEQTIQKVKDLLTPEDFETLFKEIKHMPAWMSNIFYQFKKKEKHV